jgi:nucleoid-associated protein YgaU
MGIAGIIVGVFLALSISISWIAGDKEKAKLEKQIVSEKSVQTSLDRDLAGVRRKSAADAERISELTEKLQTETSERQRLEREIEFEQRQKRIAEEQNISPDIEKIRQRLKDEIEAKSKEDIEKLEAKLNTSESSRKKAEEAWAQSELKAGRAKELEEQLRKETAVRQAAEESVKKYMAELAELNEKIRSGGIQFDADALQAKLTDAKTTVTASQSSGLINQDISKELLASIKAAEDILDQARLHKVATTEVAAKSGKESAAQFKEAPADEHAEEIKQRLTSLENRLTTLKVDKKIIDERLSEAMTAVAKMEESSQKIESALKTAPDKNADAAADLEALRLAREDMKSAMEKVKGAIQSSMEAETKMVLAEASQTTDVMGKMFSDPQLRAQALALSKTTKDKSMMNSEELKEENINALNRKIAELNMIAKTALKESGVSQETAEKVKDALSKTPFEIYIVKKGDTLSAISSKVYGKASMWPLLYKYNFLYIGSPDFIEPDATLLVRRDASNKEIKDARRKMKKRGLWTGERKHIRDWILDWLK